MAGAGRRTFQPGEVLTASNVNSYLMDQSVMRFADSTARGSAIGTAVIAEGMVSYLDDANALEFYDGASWNRFAAGSGLPIANGGTGGTTVAAAQDNLRVGLVPISPTTVEKAGTGSTATANNLGKVTYSSCTSISLNGVFSSEFENYKIVFKSSFSADGNVYFRFRKSGTDNSANAYVATGLGAEENSTVFGSSQYATSFQFVYTTANRRSAVVMDVLSPNVSAYTEAFALNTNISSDMNSRQSIFKGVTHAVNDAFDGFTFYSTTSASMTGIVQVFGYNE